MGKDAPADDMRARAVLWKKGNQFEDFFVGQKFQHHWGRTITESDTVLFSTLTLSFNPMYYNRDYAKAHGHPDIVVNPQLVFNVALGLSVEDCSEAGGPFLGVYDLVYAKPVYPGVTLTASSETIEARLSSSNPANGIVTWRTKALDSNGDVVVSFRRSNLVRLRNPKAPS
ncbi:MAG: MaoC family dehydratase [Hyphomonadaceae bacterium]